MTAVPQVLAVADHTDDFLRDLVQYGWECGTISLEKARSPRLAERMLAESDYSAMVVAAAKLTDELLSRCEDRAIPVVVVGDTAVNTSRLSVVAGSVSANELVQHVLLRISGTDAASPVDAPAEMMPLVVVTGPPNAPGASILANAMAASATLDNPALAPVLVDLAQTAPVQHLLCGLPRPERTALDLFATTTDVDEQIATCIYRSAQIGRPVQLVKGPGQSADVAFIAGASTGWASVSAQIVVERLRRLRTWRPVIVDLGSAMTNQRIAGALVVEAATTVIAARGDIVGLALLRDWLATAAVGDAPQCVVRVRDADERAIAAEIFAAHVTTELRPVFATDDSAAVTDIQERGTYRPSLLGVGRTICGQTRLMAAA